MRGILGTTSMSMGRIGKFVKFKKMLKGMVMGADQPEEEAALGEVLGGVRAALEQVQVAKVVAREEMMASGTMTRVQMERGSA